MKDVFEFSDVRPGCRCVAKFGQDSVYIDSLDLGDVCIDRDTAISLAGKLLAWAGGTQMENYRKFVGTFMLNGGVSANVQKQPASLPTMR
jgi:hypothetical protein